MRKYNCQTENKYAIALSTHLTMTLKKIEELILADAAKQLGKTFRNNYIWSWLFVDFLFLQFFLGPINVLKWGGGWLLYDSIFEFPGNGPVCFLGGVLLSVPCIMFSPEVSTFAKVISLACQ